MLELNVSCIFVRANGEQNQSDQADGSTGRRSTSNRNLTINVDPETDTVADLATRIRQKLDQSSNDTKAIDIIFAGQFLSDNTPLSSIDVGPATTLQVVVNRNKTSTEPRSKIEIEQTAQLVGEWRSAFYVYCKMPCAALRTGKLRVRCDNCESTAVVLLEEPKCWPDVLTRTALRCSCAHCQQQQTFAQFYFRCSVCSRAGIDCTCVPLPQVRTNRRSLECAICDAVSNPIVDFLCDVEDEPCSVCIDCFKGYCEVSLIERRFVLHDRFGYTLRCPTPNCNGYISDPHHFRIVGDEFYKKFQTAATESVLMDEQGVYCPRPECSFGFLIDQNNVSRQVVICPECGHSFCGDCKMSSQECFCSGAGAQASTPTGILSAARRTRTSSEHHLSLTTIRATCKPCPRCRTATERNGGCSHMSCRQCAFDWCWLCERQWTDECKAKPGMPAARRNVY